MGCSSAPMAFGSLAKGNSGQRLHCIYGLSAVPPTAMAESDTPIEPLALNYLIRLFTSQAGCDNGNFKKPFIAFVLGGPGSGKGTQCNKIASNFGFTHLSAGDLLRQEISSGSEKGESILETIKEGRIVPSEITVELIRKAMKMSNAKRVLIDGFPRCEENRIAFERIMGSEPDVVVFFDCPVDEMIKRLLGRNQGRVDDNIETIKKRLKVFESLNIPVVDYYSSKGKVHKVIVPFCFPKWNYFFIFSVNCLLLLQSGPIEDS
ncbi:hypothetical protein PR202_gb27343 [Eleusine coracana subsp. coracana]|uniref:adenylate kinase n=1 Tax=Eleusine coracana subsp. coracana TaxID=191504 RepID=A0AAV5FTY9_ELECO|nr:hypothetical protein PR202_gb27343 [Eleusine coracana subsp. coracana]